MTSRSSWGRGFAGYSALKVEDLSEVEIKSHQLMLEHLAFYRENAPGFADAFIMLSAPQLGVRHGRRLAGLGKMTREQWDGSIAPDEIGVSPPLSPKFGNVSVPYSAIVPREIEGLLAPGRHLSCDVTTHSFMREIPQCWVTGQAAGVAAAHRRQSRPCACKSADPGTKTPSRGARRVSQPAARKWRRAEIRASIEPWNNADITNKTRRREGVRQCFGYSIGMSFRATVAVASRARLRAFDGTRFAGGAGAAQSAAEGQGRLRSDHEIRDHVCRRRPRPVQEIRPRCRAGEGQVGHRSHRLPDARQRRCRRHRHRHLAVEQLEPRARHSHHRAGRARADARQFDRSAREQEGRRCRRQNARRSQGQENCGGGRPRQRLGISDRQGIGEASISPSATSTSSTSAIPTSRRRWRPDRSMPRLPVRRIRRRRSSPAPRRCWRPT